MSPWLEGLSARKPRGSVLIMGMVLVTILAMLSLTYATRIISGSKKMEREIASSRAMEFAQAANDYNMRRLFEAFKDVGYVSSTENAGTWIEANVRSLPPPPPATPPNPRQFDYLYQADFSSQSPVGQWTDDTAWSPFGSGEVKLSVRVLDRDVGNPSTGVPDVVTIEFMARARIRDDRTMSFQERQVRRLCNFTLSTIETTSTTEQEQIVVPPSQTFEFAYFVNNFGWMWGKKNQILLHGNVGSNANLSFKKGPLVNGYLFAAKNDHLGADGILVNNYKPSTETLVQYWNRGGSNTLLAPSNPAWSEDVNDNGVLDAGEDANGNGNIDFQDFPSGYPGVTSSRPPDHRLGQAPLPVPYLGTLEPEHQGDPLYLYKGLAEQYERPDRSDIASVSSITTGTYGGVIKQLKEPGLDPAIESNYKILVDKTYGDEANENGRVSKVVSGKVVVTDLDEDQKLDDDPDYQWKNGNLALIGTDAQPLIIQGPVVVTNDLVLKGKIKGQGIVYTGRNIHVAGDIVYTDPPSWSQNDATVTSKVAANKEKDMVGFGAKGSIILGQYQRYGTGSNDYWNTTVGTYFRTCFTGPAQSYQTDPTDRLIGYYNPTDGTFHGDYTKYDKVYDTDGTVIATGQRYKDNAELDGDDDTTNRKFYESSFSNEYMNTIATSRPANIHGVFYTNHLIGGRPGHSSKGVKFLGTIVARDEGIVFNKRFEINYDIRASASSVGSLFTVPGKPEKKIVTLPGNPVYNSNSDLTTVLWEEVAPGFTP